MEIKAKIYNNLIKVNIGNNLNINNKNYTIKNNNNINTINLKNKINTINVKMYNGNSLKGDKGDPGNGVLETATSGENINSFKLVKNKNGLIYYASCDNIEDINRIIGVSITSSLINNELTYQLEGTIENMGFNFTPGSNLYLGLNGDIVENPNLGLFYNLIGYAETSNKIFLKIGRSILKSI